MSLAGRGDIEFNSAADPPASPQPHASRSPQSRTRETSSRYRYFCLHRQRLIPFTHISTAAATPPANRRSRHIIPFPPVALTSCQRRDYRILFTPRRPPCHHRDRGIFTRRRHTISSPRIRRHIVHREGGRPAEPQIAQPPLKLPLTPSLSAKHFVAWLCRLSDPGGRGARGHPHAIRAGRPAEGHSDGLSTRGSRYLGTEDGDRVNASDQSSNDDAVDALWRMICFECIRSKCSRVDRCSLPVD